ncbi:TlpA family protein disulfide reductase [Flavobacterium sp. SM15]|uniref:TlpA family protein disulfide reductase n=1 Tax=Flavobacterium sp. SM15 TaxID=2908005 RepID=UPI001EDAA8CE|nr:TlpA disulfide reductase family protein [Flavobacterium sp. SM15]MCG2610504.1 TlpA family protein disulfide reductase [Flavobacterium sp. SM15]
MRKFYLFFLAFNLLSFTLFAQDSAHALFSYNIRKNISPYIKNSNAAYEKGNTVLGEKLFDSLIHNHLIGTKFDNFALKRLHKNKLQLNTIKRPIYLLTYSSWCVPSKGEIPALNKLAKKYEKDIQLVVVLWDRRHDMKRIAQRFSYRIEVCYAHETYHKDSYTVSTLKHTLGIPTTFLIDQDMNLIDIRRGGINPGPKTTYLESFNINYSRFQDGLNVLLLNENTFQSRLASHGLFP